MLGDGPIRMITLGQELTVDVDEKTLAEMQFKELQVCLFILLVSSRCNVHVVIFIYSYCKIEQDCHPRNIIDVPWMAISGLSLVRMSVQMNVHSWVYRNADVITRWTVRSQRTRLDLGHFTFLGALQGWNMSRNPHKKLDRAHLFHQPLYSNFFLKTHHWHGQNTNIIMIEHV